MLYAVPPFVASSIPLYENAAKSLIFRLAWSPLRPRASSLLWSRLQITLVLLDAAAAFSWVLLACLARRAWRSSLLWNLVEATSHAPHGRAGGLKRWLWDIYPANPPKVTLAASTTPLVMTVDGRPLSLGTGVEEIAFAER